VIRNTFLIVLFFMVTTNSFADDRLGSSYLRNLLKNKDEVSILINSQDKNFPITLGGEPVLLQHRGLSCRFDSLSTAREVYLAKASQWRALPFNPESGTLVLKKQGTQAQIRLSCFQITNRTITDNPNLVGAGIADCEKEGGIAKIQTRPEDKVGKGFGSCELPLPTLSDFTELLKLNGVSVTIKPAAKKGQADGQTPARSIEVLGDRSTK
jgi:hypothetical protein